MVVAVLGIASIKLFLDVVVLLVEVLLLEINKYCIRVPAPMRLWDFI